MDATLDINLGWEHNKILSLVNMVKGGFAIRAAILPTLFADVMVTRKATFTDKVQREVL